jgi:prophage antirepressor-like protein
MDVFEIFKYMSHIKLFESKQIRTIWNDLDEKWYFVVADVIQVLTDTPNPSDYIKKMRKRDEELSKGWGQFVPPFWLTLLAENKS